MAKLSVEKRLLQAQSPIRKGGLQDAHQAAQSVLQYFPANKKDKKLLIKIDQANKAGQVAAPQADQDKIASGAPLRKRRRFGRSRSGQPIYQTVSPVRPCLERGRGGEQDAGTVRKRNRLL